MALRVAILDRCACVRDLPSGDDPTKVAAADCLRDVRRRWRGRGILAAWVLSRPAQTLARDGGRAGVPDSLVPLGNVFAAPIDITAYSDSVNYEFRDEDYADEFLALNEHV